MLIQKDIQRDDNKVTRGVLDTAKITTYHTTKLREKVFSVSNGFYCNIQIHSGEETPACYATRPSCALYDLPISVVANDQVESAARNSMQYQKAEFHR
jgi:hypothetical protein